MKTLIFLFLSFGLHFSAAEALVCRAEKVSQIPAVSDRDFAISYAFANHAPQNGDFDTLVDSLLQKEMNRLNLAMTRIQENPGYNASHLCGLNQQEQLAFHLYSGNAFKKINSSLREQNAYNLSRLAPLIKTIVSGMNKLQPEQVPLYRGADLPTHVLEGYRPGCVVEEKGFLSTSSDLEVAESFGTQTFYYQPSAYASGVDMALFAVRSNEREILFAPGAKFKVLDRKLDKERFRQVHVFLEEVSRQTAVGCP